MRRQGGASEDPGGQGPQPLHRPGHQAGALEGKGGSLCSLPRPRELLRVGPRQAHGHALPRGQVRPGAHVSPALVLLTLPQLCGTAAQWHSGTPGRAGGQGGGEVAAGWLGPWLGPGAGG